jgi:hypothetical protein
VSQCVFLPQDETKGTAVLDPEGIQAVLAAVKPPLTPEQVKDYTAILDKARIRSVKVLKSVLPASMALIGIPMDRAVNIADAAEVYDATEDFGEHCVLGRSQGWVIHLGAVCAFHVGP